MRSTRVVLLALMILEAATIFVADAQAAPYNEIPEDVNDALFGGGNLFAAKMLLSLCILTSLGIALSASRKANMLVSAIVLISAVGFLVAIAWLDLWILVVLVIVLMTLFAKNVAGWFQS